MKPNPEKRWWLVRTDCGSIRTRAVSRGKAIRNAKYRLVMGDGRHDRPTPRDLAEMRDIEVLEVTRDDTPDGAGESGQGNPNEGMRK